MELWIVIVIAFLFSLPWFNEAWPALGALPVSAVRTRRVPAGRTGAGVFREGTAPAVRPEVRPLPPRAVRGRKDRRFARSGAPRRSELSPQAIVAQFYPSIRRGVARAMTWTSDHQFFFDCEDLTQDFVVALLEHRSSLVPPADPTTAAAYVKTSAFHYALGKIRKEQHRQLLARNHYEGNGREQGSPPPGPERMERLENCSGKDCELLHFLQLGWSIPRVADHWGQTKWAVYKRIERLKAPPDPPREGFDQLR